VHEGDIGALQALLEDGPVKKCCIVCLEKQPRQLTKNIEAYPGRVLSNGCGAVNLNKFKMESQYLTYCPTASLTDL